MKEYNVYFEIYGKKLKTTVVARDAQDARRVVMSRIIWDKVEEVEKPAPPTGDEMLNTLKNIFGI